MPDTTARRARKWSTRALYVLAPASGVALLAFLFGWMPETPGRVVYQTLLMLTCTAIVVAAVSAGQLAIAQAFRAGYMTGLELGKAEQAGRDGGKHLRVVRDATGTGEHPPVR